MATVFISYANSDEGVALGVKAFLDREGVSAYFAPVQARSGPFVPVLAEEILAARVVVVIASDAATERTWVAEELTYARAHHKECTKPLPR